MYSFGILAWSVLTLKIPYIGYNHKQWYKHVIMGKQRPKLYNEFEISESMKNLLRRCWSDDIFFRPDFDYIENELRNETCSW